MNIFTPVTDAAQGRMTSKGQVLIPKALRDRAGIIPGGEITVAMNDQGDIVVRARHDVKTQEERRARLRAAIESVRGTLDTGFATTDEYMDFIRPHRRETW